MNRLMIGFYLLVLLVQPWHTLAGQVETPKHIVGTLQCKVLAHSGLNLLIHSSRDIRCVFTPEDSTGIVYYKGETGIKFGVDVGFGKREIILYSVLARDLQAAPYSLAGKYSGASGSATLGVSAGDSAPIEKSDGSIALQPIQTHASGVGAAVGFSYLYLEADKQPK